VEYLHKRYPAVFEKVLDHLARRVPGITSVDSRATEEGRVLLRFQDGAFEDPFLARYVSDGTTKMLAYLVLLLDPKPRPPLCVEEPENQLYPALLGELAEEFRSCASRGGQVFVSTHSPDFLNATELDEVFWRAMSPTETSSAFYGSKGCSPGPTRHEYARATCPRSLGRSRSPGWHRRAAILPIAIQIASHIQSRNCASSSQAARSVTARAEWAAC